PARLPTRRRCWRVGKADTPANWLQFCVPGDPYFRGKWKSLLETLHTPRFPDVALRCTVPASAVISKAILLSLWALAAEATPSFNVPSRLQEAQRPQLPVLA
ncbi:hypothetical protein CABS03_07304, partial [Colletotrichum abscissum]